MIIKHHAELAKHIEGSSVLLMNSLGKDSALCLEWLAKFASLKKVVSLTLDQIAHHPGDKPYLEYLRARYPHVEFLIEPSALVLSDLCHGDYQSPIDVLRWCNEQEYDTFDYDAQVEAIRVEKQCDYICLGVSRHESYTRANFFHRKGILVEKKIFPLGMMSKKQVVGLIRDSGLKIHPTYKVASSSLDQPSYYKMRAAFIASPKYKQEMYKLYPLLALDEFRWEKMLRGKSGQV